MKTTLIIILLLGGGVCIVSSTYKAPITTQVVLLRDITDSGFVQLTEHDITALYDLKDDNRWNGAEFSFSNLNDVSYNKTETALLPPVNKWLSNELERDKEVTLFEASVATILTDAMNDFTGKRSSSLYIPIANALIHLSQSKAERRILIVSSDLLENEADISFYNKTEFQLLRVHPDSVKSIFEKEVPLPSLNNIEVHFIYQPTTQQNDAAYRVVSEFYKSLLQDKGARVNIGANL